MPLVRVRDKGQVTLPLDVRRELGLRQGDLLEASVKGGQIVLEPMESRRPTPVSVSASNLERLVGMMSAGGDAVEDSARYDE